MDTYLNKNPSDNPLESLETKSLGLNIRKFCERCALKMLPLFSLIITKNKKKKHELTHQYKIVCMNVN